MEQKCLPPLNQDLDAHAFVQNLQEVGPSACQSLPPQEPQDSHCSPRLAHTTAEGPSTWTLADWCLLWLPCQIWATN